MDSEGRPPSLMSNTHARTESEAPVHFHDDLHAPVTAVHDTDPYAPVAFDEQSMHRASMIHVHPPADSGGGYFGEQLSDSPRGTLRAPSNHEGQNSSPNQGTNNVVRVDQPHHIDLPGRSPGMAVVGGGLSRQPVRKLINSN